MKRILLILSIMVLIFTVASCDKNKDHTSSAPHNSINSTVSTPDNSADNSIHNSEISRDESIDHNNSAVDSTTSRDDISGNNSENSFPDTSGTSTAQYIKIINSGNYTMKLTLPVKIGDDVVNQDVTCHYKNNKTVILNKEYGATVKTIIDGNIFYTFDDDKKIIYKFPISEYAGLQIPSFKNLEYAGFGNDIVENKNYDIEIFKDENKKYIKFYYDSSKQLKYVESYLPSFNDYILYQINITKGVPNESVFSLPSGYTTEDLT